MGTYRHGLVVGCFLALSLLFALEGLSNTVVSRKVAEEVLLARNKDGDLMYAEGSMFDNGNPIEERWFFRETKLLGFDVKVTVSDGIARPSSAIDNSQTFDCNSSPIIHKWGETKSSSTTWTATGNLTTTVGVEVSASVSTFVKAKIAAAISAEFSASYASSTTVSATTAVDQEFKPDPCTRGIVFFRQMKLITERTITVQMYRIARCDMALKPDGPWVDGATLRLVCEPIQQTVMSEELMYLTSVRCRWDSQCDSCSDVLRGNSSPNDFSTAGKLHIPTNGTPSGHKLRSEAGPGELYDLNGDNNAGPDRTAIMVKAATSEEEDKPYVPLRNEQYFILPEQVELSDALESSAVLTGGGNELELSYYDVNTGATCTGSLSLNPDDHEYVSFVADPASGRVSQVFVVDLVCSEELGEECELVAARYGWSPLELSKLGILNHLDAASVDFEFVAGPGEIEIQKPLTGVVVSTDQPVPVRSILSQWSLVALGVLLLALAAFLIYYPGGGGGPGLV